MQAIQAQYFHVPFGSIVGTRFGLFNIARHVGILAPHPVWGLSVISFTTDGIIEQPAEEFAGGRAFDSIEYPSAMPWQFVVQRARMVIAHPRYNFLQLNCEHFARYCHGLKLESPQISAVAVLAVLGAGLVIATSSQRSSQLL